MLVTLPPFVDGSDLDRALLTGMVDVDGSVSQSLVDRAITSIVGTLMRLPGRH